MLRRTHLPVPACLAAALTVASALALSPALSPAAPPRDLDARIESLRRDFGVPGIAIAIVEDGATTLARGYGVRKLGDDAAVDAATLFQTGSTGKAFTAAGLALLVDSGEIGWDDRVIEHMPWFRLHDPWVTREITIRDLLVHRSGLGRGAGDLLFVPRGKLSRRETVERMAHIEPASSFRSRFAYCNICYAAIGQLIEEVTGERWEDYTQQRLFAAAGMRDSVADSAARFANDNRSYPHARLDGALRGAGDQALLDEREELGRNAAPAGGLAMSARDMATWLGIQLAGGALPDGGRLFSEAAAREMWTPVVALPATDLPEPLDAAEARFNGYALGWSVRDYRGNRMISHGGGVFGSITMVALLPEQDVGFAIMMNSEDVAVLSGLTYELLDHYVGAPFSDWPARWAAFHERRIGSGLETLAKQKAKPAAVGPSLPAARYAGRYVDPWYGEIEISEDPGNGDRLRIEFGSTPRMSGALEHWQYDTFITRFEDETIEPAYVTFALDANGSVSRITMKAASPLADFSYDYHDLELTPVGTSGR